MKAPLEEPGRLPFEFWTRIAPSDWREREVDFDGPDADGCMTGVMVFEKDFQYWLDNLKPASQPKSRGGKVPLIMDHLRSMFPQGGVPDASHYPRKQLRADLVKLDKRLEPLDDATLKSAIEAFNHSIRNDPK
jgi:hypothetical protein